MAGARPLGPLPGPLHRHSSIQTESSRLCPTTCWLSKLSCSESGTQTGPDAGPKTSSTQPSSCLIHTALILTSRLPATSPQRGGRAWLGSITQGGTQRSWLGSCADSKIDCPPVPSIPSMFSTAGFPGL